MDIEIIITLLIASAGLGLAIINAIINYIQQKRIKTSILKLPLKKRLFNQWYEMAKNIANQIEFTEIKTHENFTVYNFLIKKKDGSGYIDKSQQRILVRRLGEKSHATFEECGYKKKVEKIHTLELAPLHKTMGPFDFTHPNDQLPKDTEDLKREMLQDIIDNAKENGVKIKR